MHSLVASVGVVCMAMLFVRDIVGLKQLLEVFEGATVDRELTSCRRWEQEGMK